MAVMQNMREYTKTILIILVLAFVGTIIFNWGMDITGLKTRQGVLGKVNGQEITLQQFNQAYSNQLEQYRQRTNSDLDENQTSYLREQVWDMFVRNILIDQAIKQKHIKATDQEIIYRLFNAPPAMIRNNPNFQNDQKQFDFAKYNAALNNPPFPNYWQYWEENLRYYLPQQELENRIVSAARITDDEIKREYLKQNQKATVEYVFFNPNVFGDDQVSVSDQEISAYYKAHPDEFKEAEQRKIEYVIFPKKMTAQDSLEKKQLAEELVQRLNAGEDFAELAEIYSEDPGTKDKGGDLGYFGKGAMVKPFEEAAFAAKKGAIIGPIQTKFGLHIIKVEDKRVKNGEEQVKARHILLKFEPTRKTIEKARDDASYFAEDTRDVPFEELAQEQNLETQTSNFFPEGAGFIPGIGRDPDASRHIFSTKVGSVGDVVETPQGFVVYKVADIKKAGIKSLEEVKPTIQTKLVLQKKMELAEQKAKKVYEKIQSEDASFAAITTSDSLEVKKTEPFTRAGFVTGVGRDAKFIGTAFALNENQVSEPVEGTRGYYIIKLLEKTKLDPEDYSAKKNAIAQQLLQKMQNQIYSNWYANLKEKAKIKDYRGRYF